jgi:hypothetical protein
MLKKSTISYLFCFLIILVVILIWPKIYILGNFTDDSPLFSQITIAIWNRGAEISGFYFAKPEVCVYANVSDVNITCTHNSYRGKEKCEYPVCGSAEIGSTPYENTFYLDYHDRYPDNFSITVSANADLGNVIRVGHTTSIFNCKKKLDLYQYNCIKEN